MTSPETTAERVPPLAPIPARVLDLYFTPSVREKAIDTFVDERGKKYEAFETSEPLQGLEDAVFRITYIYEHGGRPLPRYIDFDYIAPVRQTVRREEQLVAQMGLMAINDTEFSIPHRKVEPQFGRGQGVGTGLMTRAEEWLRYYAGKTGHDITLTVTDAGQLDVIKFYSGLGYEPDEKSTAALEEFRAHPEHFTIREKDLSLFRKDENGNPGPSRISIVFRKTFTAGDETPNP